MRKIQSIDRLYVLIALLLGILSFLAPYALSGSGAAANYRNVTVTTTLNITNSFPVVLSTTIGSSYTLNAGSTTIIQCNATVRDFDGIGTDTVNATFYDTSTTTAYSANDNNNHYTNTSCTRVNNNSIQGNFTCTFPVQYYANSGSTWNCVVSATDNTNITGNNTNTTTIQQLIALNITPQTIDYGNMVVGGTSPAINANVTNFGNSNINVSVEGYGGTRGDNLAMVCTYNNIPINYERFSLNGSDSWAAMTALTGAQQNITGLTIDQRTNDTLNDRINSTYWKINVPASSNPGGKCNGTVIFEAHLA